ncbi:DEAD-domain-containing protein [Thelephora ganbajun]|uniref:DEAD-domain-containing protein n=1 Tax=Thelephora ganbajun TaxID=370292 RepID=A0ACB6ZJ88_THEGA|nr:DEAD-domain-containing protein [Thelephora ganbajun]
MADPQQACLKAKTKAKKRYLKAKKERRKQRKNTARDGTLPEGETSDNPEDVPPEKTPTVINLTQQAEQSGFGTEGTIKKTKKRKLHRSIPGDFLEDQQSKPVEEVKSSLVDEPKSHRALPQFPLPTRPDAPSKIELALQGLNRAQIEAELVDPNSTLPIHLDADHNQSFLGLKTRKRLIELGVNELFAVQTAIIPFLLRPVHKYTSLYDPYHPPRDMCVEAPTGSGKTLAYALPIIELLSTRVVTRLRALIVLPTRDLVTQVREVLEMTGRGRGLKIGTVTGQHSFPHEQAQLVTDEEWRTGRTSKVDILVCTPGRLIDHIDGTPLFTLRDLRFLVIDEADKLLDKSFQDWLTKVLAVIQRPYHLYLPPTTPRRGFHLLENPSADSGVTASPISHESYSEFRTDYDEPKHSPCQKLLFSATLTSDPGKIASLGLRDPKYFIVRETATGATDSHHPVSKNFSMPANLTERMIVCDPSRKPLILFYLVHVRQVDNALVFTKSAESTARLVKLLELLEENSLMTGPEKFTIRSYSSDLPPSERKSILEQFREKKIDVLVCSDLISRGLDISHVAHVVSYDVPIDIRKYVHRVGRTARAGRHGEAWTLVEEQEARYFKTMMKDAGHFHHVKKLRISDKELFPFTAAYDISLLRLKEFYWSQ